MPRWLVSGALALVVLGAYAYLPVPGVDQEVLHDLSGGRSDPLALVMPLLVLGYLFGALAPAALGRLAPALYLLAVGGWAGLEAYATSGVSVGAIVLVPEPGARFVLLYAATHLGLAGLTWWLASVWTARGLGQGHLLMPAVYLLAGLPTEVVATVQLAASSPDAARWQLGLSFLGCLATVTAAALAGLRIEAYPAPLAERLAFAHPLDVVAAPAVVSFALAPVLGIDAVAIVVAALLVLRAGPLGRRIRPAYLALAGVALATWLGLVGYGLAADPEALEALAPAGLGVPGPAVTVELEGSAQSAEADGAAIVRRIRAAGGWAEVIEARGTRLRLEVRGEAPEQLVLHSIRRRRVELLGQSEAQGELDAGANLPPAGVEALPYGESSYLQGPETRMRDLVSSLPAVRGRRPVLDCEEGRCTAFYVDEPAIVTARDIVEAKATRDEYVYGYSVSLRMSDEAAARFERATARLIGKKIVIELDGVVDSAPIVQSAIPGGSVQITMGSFGDPDKSKAEARALASALAGGPLEADWKLVSAP